MKSILKLPLAGCLLIAANVRRLADVFEIIKLKYMTKVDFTNWLHSELDAVFNREQTPEQMMLKAIPMIHEFSSQNNGKPLVLSSRESVVNECRDELLKHLFKVFHTNGYPIEAVPKATVLSLPQLMRCSSSPIA